VLIGVDMWLIITFITAVIALFFYFFLKSHRQKLKLPLLTLMLFGAFLLVLIDHIIAFINGRQFIEFTTDGLVKNGAILGFLMIVPILLIWIVAVLMQHKFAKHKHKV
jgi:hypothetical protein